MRMGTAELFLLAVGLSMDALAVALCKGLALGKLDLGRALWVGLWFGGFQGLMPLAGWALGAGFARSIAAIDHWVAFLLLGWLGGNMLCTARADEPEDSSAALDLRAAPPTVPTRRPSSSSSRIRSASSTSAVWWRLSWTATASAATTASRMCMSVTVWPVHS